MGSTQKLFLGAKEMASSCQASDRVVSLPRTIILPRFEEGIPSPSPSRAPPKTQEEDSGKGRADPRTVSEASEHGEHGAKRSLPGAGDTSGEKGQRLRSASGEPTGGISELQLELTPTNTGSRGCKSLAGVRGRSPPGVTRTSYPSPTRHLVSP